MNNELRQVYRRRAGAAFMAGAFALGGAGVAYGDCDTGNLTITAINPNPVYVDAFPATDVALSATLVASGSGFNFQSLAPITVTFDGQPVTSDLVINEPPDGVNAVVNFSVDIPAPGDYVVVVTGERGNTDYCDTAQVASAVGTISAEWKAPPALANEYINDTPNYRNTASGGVRGCIISQIAHHHAKEDKYGPKGGDGDLWPGVGYDLATIQMDVDDYYVSCRNEEIQSQGNGRGRGR
jgi:hypothetical protein